MCVGGQDISYDQYGQPSNYRGSQTYFANGKLSSFGLVGFTYDGAGRRTKIRVYQYDYASFIYDGEGNIFSALISSEEYRFIYDGSGVIGIVKGNDKYIFRKNVQGDITHIYSIDGSLVCKYVYDAWGNHKVLNPDGTENITMTFIGNVNPYRYRGYYFDVATGLYYLQTRYYDPETGRFISQDDFSYLAPETINGLNLYAYCGNNPIMRIDPNGNAWWHWLAGGLIIAALAAATIITAGVAGIGIGTAFAAGFTGATLAASSASAGVALAATACTVFSSAFAGAVICAGLGMIAGGVTTNNGEIGWSWESAADGFMWGAISGGVAGILGSISGSIGQGTKFYKIIQSGINAAISGSITVGQGLITNQFSWDSVIISSIFGGLGGFLGASQFKKIYAEILRKSMVSFGLTMAENILGEIMEYLQNPYKQSFPHYYFETYNG